MESTLAGPQGSCREEDSLGLLSVDQGESKIWIHTSRLASCSYRLHSLSVKTETRRTYVKVGGRFFLFLLAVAHIFVGESSHPSTQVGKATEEQLWFRMKDRES